MRGQIGIGAQKPITQIASAIAPRSKANRKPRAGLRMLIPVAQAHRTRLDMRKPA